MNKMGLDLIRSNNTKCPPILFCGLLIMCFFLLCNWWSLSSQNFELLKQIDNLAQQLRVNGEELGKCSQQKMLLDEKLKDSQTKFVQQQIKIEQFRETENEAKENYEKIQTDLKEAKTKCESDEKKLEICSVEMNSLKKLSDNKEKALEALRIDKESLKSDLLQKEEKIKKLEERINSKELSNSKIYSLLKEMQDKVKRVNEKNLEKDKNNKFMPNNDGQRYSNPVEKEAEESKNYGDQSLLPVDNDPREQAMKAS